MEEKLRIRLHMYETDLMVNVPQEKEPYYRAAAKQVTETVNTYAKIYQGKKTHNDILYMAMLDLALRSNKLAAQNATQPFTDLISKLTQEIEEAMEDKVWRKALLSISDKETTNNFGVIKE